jgi:hypothetical protein
VIKIEPFRAFHAELLFAGGVQASQVTIGSANVATLGQLSGCALAAWADGRVIVCGGVVPFAPWHGTLWAILAQEAGRHMLEVHRAVGRFLDAQRYRRLEASVPQNFPAACRWLELLHFHPEGVLEAYGEDGQDHLRYARIRRS